MLLHNRPVSILKNFSVTFVISAMLFFTGTGISPSLTAEETKAPAEETATTIDAGGALSSEQLDKLVGPIALYPDELIAIVLPASTYPLQIVQAARYLEKHKKDSKAKPDEEWDSSVLGLLNYPEVIDQMNGDLDWTWALGEAVVNQQNDVMDAIQQFRNKAYTAGNLESNKQTIIIQEKEIIKIESATPEVIYVPTYNPATVIVQQPAPYPYYYSAPYPYYYSPAATFWTGMFVGAAISYGVGWGRYGSGNNDININRGGNTVNLGSGNTWSPNRAGGQAGGRPGGGTRPGAGNRPGAGGGGNRPGAGGGGNRPGAGGGGNRPGAGGGGNRPSAGGGGNRPSAGTRPSSGSRPSAGQQPSRTKTGKQGSFGGYKNGQTTAKNSQRGQSSRSSQSSSRSSRSSASRGGGGGRSASRGGGGGRSGGGGGGRRR